MITDQPFITLQLVTTWRIIGGIPSLVTQQGCSRFTEIKIYHTCKTLQSAELQSQLKHLGALNKESPHSYMSRQAFLLCYRCRKSYLYLDTAKDFAFFQIQKQAMCKSCLYQTGKCRLKNRMAGRITQLQAEVEHAQGAQFQPQVKQRSGCTGQLTLPYQGMG